MLKLFYKTILVSLLSTTLLLSSVIAADDMSPDSESTSPSSPTEDMLSSIGMISVGIITTHIYTYKPGMTADMDLAAAGGSTYVTAEVSSTSEFKVLEAYLQLEVAKVSEGKQTEAQADLKKSYLEAKDILERKLVLQKAAAESFSSASITAYKMKESESSSSAEVSISDPFKPVPKITFTSKLISLAVSPAIAGEAENKLLKTPQFDKCTKKLKAIGEGGLSSPAVDKCGMWSAKDLKNQADIAIDAVLKLVAARDLDEARAKLETEVGKVQALKEKLKSKNPECASLINDVKQECTEFGKLLADHETFKSAVIQGLFSSIPTPQKKSNYVEKLLDLAMDKAEASSFLSIFGLGEADTSIIMVMTPELAKEVDKLMFSPAKRARVWASLEGRANKAAEATRNEIDKIDSNIEKMNGLLKGVVQNESRNVFESITNFIISKAKAETNKFSPTTATKNLAFGVKLPCLTGPGNSNCSSLSTHISSAAGFNILPPLFQKTAKQITDFADELSGATSISSKVMSDANNIANKHTALNSLLKQYQDKREIQAQNILNKKCNSITATALHKKGFSPATFFANYSGTTFSKTDASSNSTKTINKKLGQTSSANGIPKAQGLAKEGGSTADPVATKKLKDKNYKVNDISQTKDESIFTVISNRYLRSAFPRFFAK